MSNERILKVAASDDRLDEVLDFVGDLLTEYEYPLKKQMGLKVAIEEVFVNIAHYAYPNAPESEKWAEICISVDDGVATFSFKDGGVPFNPLAKEDPDVTLSGEERDIGGLGIFLVKKQMDDVSYEFKDGCNILRLKKRIV